LVEVRSCCILWCFSFVVRIKKQVSMSISWLQIYRFHPVYDFCRHLDILRWACVRCAFNVRGHLLCLTAVRIVSSFISVIKYIFEYSWTYGMLCLVIECSVFQALLICRK
jgi:hypothetical protein